MDKNDTVRGWGGGGGVIVQNTVKALIKTGRQQDTDATQRMASSTRHVDDKLQILAAQNLLRNTHTHTHTHTRARACTHTHTVYSGFTNTCCTRVGERIKLKGLDKTLDCQYG